MSEFVSKMTKPQLRKRSKNMVGHDQFDKK